MSELKELKNDLGTKEFTEILYNENSVKYNAPHEYIIKRALSKNYVLATIDFQCGPVKTHGVNGVFNEDLINIVIDRLEHFQKSEFNCIENEKAIEKLKESLIWLRKRTDDRKKRGVQGTYKI
jgi:hypothetical protein